LTNETMSAHLSSKLDSMRREVLEVLRSMPSKHTRGVQGWDNARNSPVTENLEECVQSASQIVSSASAIVGSRTTVYGRSNANSVIGDRLSTTRNQAIERWISEPIAEEYLPQASPLVESLSVVDNSASLGPSYDNLDILEAPKPSPEALEKWQASGVLNYNSGNYVEAEPFLVAVLQQSERVYGQEFRGKFDLLGMLAKTCSQQCKWNEAEQHILAQLQIRNLEGETISKLLYSLAEVYHYNGETNTAATFCQRAMKGTARNLGSQYYRCVCLLARIYAAQDDYEEASNCKSLLPPKFRRLIPSLRLLILSLFIN